MYTVTNFKSKAALKRAIAAGDQVTTYQPGGFFPAETEGIIYLEGPHYPEPHRWYAQAQVKDGIIIKGTVK